MPYDGSPNKKHRRIEGRHVVRQGIMARQISPAKDLPHWNSLPEVPALTLLETLKYDLLIHGEWRPAKSGDRFDVENPATGECIASMANAGESDVADAVESAQTAFTGGPWSTMTGGDRGRIMWKMADLIEERADELGNLESISNGRPISETSSQMAVVASYFRYFAGFCDKIQGTTIPTSSSHLNYTTRVPLGVVGQLTPWNHPLMIASKKLAPALAAGCTVVLKPSEWAPLTPTEIGVIALEAGLPPGVLNIVNGFGPTSGKALASDSRLGKLDLTGGTETGRTVAKLAGENQRTRGSKGFTGPSGSGLTRRRWRTTRKPRRRSSMCTTTSGCIRRCRSCGRWTIIVEIRRRCWPSVAGSYKRPGSCESRRTSNCDSVYCPSWRTEP